MGWLTTQVRILNLFKEKSKLFQPCKSIDLQGFFLISNLMNNYSKYKYEDRFTF